MKKFIIIHGAMGVGKTSVCKELNKRRICYIFVGHSGRRSHELFSKEVEQQCF